MSSPPTTGAVRHSPFDAHTRDAQRPHAGASWLRVFVLAVIAATGAACNETSSTVENDLDALPRIAFEEEMRIGSVDDPDYGFTGINSVDVDRDGQIYAFEATDVQIRVYSPDGQLVRRIGRRGEGPGEFRRSPRFGVLGDTIWAIESSNRRLTLFRRDGTVISTAPVTGVTVPLHNNIGIVMPVAMRDDGLFTSDLTIFSSARGVELNVGMNDTVPVPRVLFAASGQPVDTVGWMPRAPPRQTSPEMIEVGGTRYWVPPPPSDEPLSITLPDGRIVVDRPIAPSAEPATLRLTRLDLAGDTVYSRSWTYRPRPFDDTALDTLAWRTARTPGGGIPIIGGVPVRPPTPADSMDAFRVIRGAMDYPAFQPPVRSNRLGKDGSVWLMREEDGGATQRWSVFDSRGMTVGEIALPRANYPVWIGAKTFWVIERDNFDVPWLVRYRMHLE